MPIYKIKEQIMKNLLFTFPEHIFTEHLYITYHIYIYKQYITNIKILRILITVTTTAVMLVIKNNNDNIKNNITITIAPKKKRNKESSEDLDTSQEFSNFNVYFLDIHRNLFELCLL